MTNTATLRPWQARMMRTLADRDRDRVEQSFTVVATPGAGKTFAAGQAVLNVWRELKAQQLIVVVPTSNLRRQWATEMARQGVQLDPMFTASTGTPAACFHGVTVTYHAVAKDPRAFAALVAERRTIVVFDEIHHCGNDTAWGDGVKNAFAGAVWTLNLSGTPFRSDSEPIPFLRYDEQGGVQADTVYDYAQAVADNVCRPVRFSVRDGEVEWMHDGIENQGRLMPDADLDFDAEGRSEREVLTILANSTDESRLQQQLRSAIAAKSAILAEALADADRDLTDRRESTPDAGGLVIADDQAHAREIAEMLHTLTGEQATLVLSDNADAEDELNAYRNGDSRWIVAVRMVSEGVDVPRLQVLVFATAVTTEMFFRQAVGRVVRVRQGDPEGTTAAVYVPGCPRLRLLAGALEAEVRGRAIMPDGSLDDGPVIKGADGKTRGGWSRLPFEVLGSTALHAVDVLACAQHHRQSALVLLSPEQEAEQAVWKRVRAARARITSLVAEIGEMRRERDPEFEWADLRRALNEHIGVRTIGQADEQQLADGIVWLGDELDDELEVYQEWRDERDSEVAVAA